MYHKFWLDYVRKIEKTHCHLSFYLPLFGGCLGAGGGLFGSKRSLIGCGI